MTVETEKKASIIQFTEEDRFLLIENGFVIVQFTGKSLYDFENQGYKFVTFSQYLQNKDKVFSEKSRNSEVALIPTGIYLPDSYRSSYDDQVRLLKDDEERIKRLGIKNIKVIFPSVADCMEIADLEMRQNNNIFGFKFGYLYSRTSTSNSSDSTVIIGCDDLSIKDDIFGRQPVGEFRGIHIQDYPKANNLNSGLNVMPIIIPA